jgi:toxin ParE1/3/4
MYALVWSDTASTDLNEIAVFVADASFSRAIADAVVHNLIVRCERLASLPGILGTARPELGADVRSTPHKGYVIFFRYVGAVLEILNVLHGSRDFVAHFADDLSSPQ